MKKKNWIWKIREKWKKPTLWHKILIVILPLLIFIVILESFLDSFLGFNFNRFFYLMTIGLIIFALISVYKLFKLFFKFQKWKNLNFKKIWFELIVIFFLTFIISFSPLLFLTPGFLFCSWISLLIYFLIPKNSMNLILLQNIFIARLSIFLFNLLFLTLFFVFSHLLFKIKLFNFEFLRKIFFYALIFTLMFGILTYKAILIVIMPFFESILPKGGGMEIALWGFVLIIISLIYFYILIGLLFCFVLEIFQVYKKSFLKLIKKILNFFGISKLILLMMFLILFISLTSSAQAYFMENNSEVHQHMTKESGKIWNQIPYNLKVTKE